MSDRKRTFSSERSVGTLIGPTSANGTRAYSACPPANPPSMCEYPKIPDGERPISLSAIQKFGFEFSQSENNPPWHDRQLPHAIGNGTTTRLPALRFFTPG